MEDRKMKFDDLDSIMRTYERSLDQRIPDGQFMVARLDGRGFTRLTKEVRSDLERPFDVRFRDAMVETARHLMRCGFEVIYAYNESDEISLLFAYGTTVFDRKVRKYNSILAGEASAAFTRVFGEIGVFDCRMVPLPDLDAVRDYFRWRQEDSHRNSLNAYVYWTMRNQGMSAREADKTLLKISNERKKEILSEVGIDYESTPAWQRWGTGLYMEKIERRGINPKTGKEEVGYGNAIKVDYELPDGEPYGEKVWQLAAESYSKSQRHWRKR
jgi:tRNA(His) 5'-end guanylyltransferase